LRILILTPEYDGAGGGIFTFYSGLARGLHDADVEVHVVEGSAVYTSKDCARRDLDGVRVETLEFDRFSRWMERFTAYAAMPGLQRHLAAAWAMWEQADFGTGVDIVEATDWGLLFIPPAIQATRPLVVQCHGSIGQIADHDPMASEATENILVRLIERDVLSTLGGFQTLSLLNATFWQAETGRSVATILPAWSTPNILEDREPNDRGLVVGRLQRWKGPAVLCEALRRLASRAPCIDWVGRDTAWGARDGSTAKHLAQAYGDVWQTKLVHHLPISPAEVAHRQARALFNIVPSTWDVFNFTVVEAMASGRPVIVSTGAGASELIEDGVNGYLFANDDADALAGAIERLMSETPARLAEIGREGRSAVLDRLDPKAITARRLAAYRAAIDAFSEKPSVPVGGWLGAVCRPSDAFGYDMMFLENFPVRGLLKHVAERIFRRVRLR
jgi:glycosyltransferase involved in cell wall biosynthesis